MATHKIPDTYVNCSECKRMFRKPPTSTYIHKLSKGKKGQEGPPDEIFGDEVFLVDSLAYCSECVKDINPVPGSPIFRYGRAVDITRASKENHYRWIERPYIFLTRALIACSHACIPLCRRIINKVITTHTMWPLPDTCVECISAHRPAQNIVDPDDLKTIKNMKMYLWTRYGYPMEGFKTIKKDECIRLVNLVNEGYERASRCQKPL